MKQLFLLLIIAASAISVSAQKDYRRNDRNESLHYKNDRIDRRDLHKNHGNRQEFRRQSAIINRDYDSRINYIRKSPFMRRNVKARKIRELEAERRVALNQSRERFTGKKVRDYARDRRHDNGKW